MVRSAGVRSTALEEEVEEEEEEKEEEGEKDEEEMPFGSLLFLVYWTAAFRMRFRASCGALSSQWARESHWRRSEGRKGSKGEPRGKVSLRSVNISLYLLSTQSVRMEEYTDARLTRTSD